MEYHTGDIILFSGKSDYFSQIIEWWTGTEYSHVGFILVKPIYLNPNLTGTYVWESGWQSFPDADDETKCTFGVRLTRIEDYIATYNGNIKIRSINKELPENYQETLKYLYSKYQHKPYDTEILDWVRIAFNFKIGDIYNTEKFFCSAWVTFILCKLNLINISTHPWDLSRPNNLSSDSLKDTDLINGYSYSKEKNVI